MTANYYLDQKPSLAELTEHVNVGTKWRQVGIQLELNPRRLDAIDVECKDIDTKLSKMYQLWLSTTPNATRRQLLQVLRLSSIAEHTIASQYEEFCSQFMNTEGKINYIYAIIACLCNLATTSINITHKSVVQLGKFKYRTTTQSSADRDVKR